MRVVWWRRFQHRTHISKFVILCIPWSDLEWTFVFLELVSNQCRKYKEWFPFLGTKSQQKQRLSCTATCCRISISIRFSWSKISFLRVFYGSSLKALTHIKNWSYLYWLLGLIRFLFQAMETHFLPVFVRFDRVLPVRKGTYVYYYRLIQLSNRGKNLFDIVGQL